MLLTQMEWFLDLQEQTPLFRRQDMFNVYRNGLAKFARGKSAAGLDLILAYKNLGGQIANSCLIHSLAEGHFTDCDAAV